MNTAAVTEVDATRLVRVDGRVVINMPTNTPSETLASVQRAINKAVVLIGENLIRDADRLAELIVGVATPSDDLLNERIERRKTINLLTEQTGWLTASMILDSTSGHPRTVADWKRRGRIFAVTGADGKDLYPAYQFNAAMQPLPVIASVLKVFGQDVDPWVLVAWFHFPNGWLIKDGDPERQAQAPKAALADATAVVRAAKQHGTSYIS